MTTSQVKNKLIDLVTEFVNNHKLQRSKIDDNLIQQFFDSNKFTKN